MSSLLTPIRKLALLTSLCFLGNVTDIHSSTLKEETLTSPSSRHKVRIYQQDPSVTELGVCEVVIPTRLDDGPSNEYIRVSQNPAKADANGDFLFEPGTPEFQSTHVFSVVWMAMRMYRQDLEELQKRYPNKQRLIDIIKHWDSVKYTSLAIMPVSEVNEANAFYDRYTDDSGKVHRELRFGFFSVPDPTAQPVAEPQPPEASMDEQSVSSDIPDASNSPFMVGQPMKMINTCESLDVVSHEGGHSILDIIQPSYFDNPTMWTAAFHEAWGDLTAMFTALKKMDLCTRLYSDTKGDLGKESWLTDMAEQFGASFGSSTGLRDMLEPVKLGSVDMECHALSRVFTNAIYGVFKDAYTAAALQSEHVKDGEMIIYEVAQHLRQLVLLMVVEMKRKQPTFSDFAYRLYRMAENQPYTTDNLSSLPWTKFIKENFEAKGVPVEKNCAALRKMTSSSNAGAKLHICGTAHRQMIGK